MLNYSWILMVLDVIFIWILNEFFIIIVIMENIEWFDNNVIFKMLV